MHKKISRWAKLNYMNLAVFNFMMVIFALLHIAEYFDPYWLISINTIVFLALVLSIILLRANSRVLFSISLFFFLLACVMKLIKIEVWAERLGVYVFQTICLGAILLFFENFGIVKKDTYDR